MYGLTDFVMWMNSVVRSHPSRWLYSERVLGHYVDEQEMPFFERDWGEGAVWDVGASIGKYTPVLAKHSPRAKIYAFEPNLNSLFYLGYRCARYSNVVIVPNALTPDGGLLKGTFDPDFNAPPTGPLVSTISLREAVAKTGPPKFVKMDIEGGEYGIFESPDSELLRRSTILVSWHPQLGGKPIPQVEGWKNSRPADNLSLLEPL